MRKKAPQVITCPLVLGLPCVDLGWDIYGIGVKNNAFKRSILEEVVTVPTSEYLFIMNDHQFRSVMKGIVRLKDVGKQRGYRLALSH